MVRNKERKSRILKRDFKEKRPNEWDQDRRKPKPDGDGYQETVTSNAAFEEYYQRQGIVPEGEWEAFLACLRTPLPTTFRINGGGKFAAELREKLEHDFFAKITQVPQEVEGEPLLPPKPLPWYPNKLAWQLTYSRVQLRKVKALADVHELLKRENTAGGISRQEAVSMVPPLFMDIQPHHKVLDTCASPGSKTAQMLEMLHEAGGLPTGFVVANDIEPQRCNLLVHQTKRMHSPALLVTNHDASTFPLIAPKGSSKGQAMQFDRILCDVPCSGDGTLRKAADIWRKWNVVNGTGLHPLQVRITLHNAGLLRVGGRMVYSTCSLNPIEDEAVVAEVLRQSKGALQLADVSSQLPELKRCEGLHRWLVKGSKNQYFTSYDEAEEANPNNNFSPSMFPAGEAEAGALPLERCMRVLPHHGDTGGFFIAVLDKVADMPPVQPERWKRTKDKRWEERKKMYQERAKQQAAEAATAGQAGSESAAGEAAAAGASEPEAPAAGAAENEPVLTEGAQEAAEGGEAAMETAPAEAELTSEAAPGDAARGGDGGTKAKGSRRERRPKPGDEPLEVVADKPLLDRLINFFGLGVDFPLRDQLVARVGASNVSGARKLYFVTDGVREVLAKDESRSLKITSAGLKVFERNDKKDPHAAGSPYRVAQEGLGLLLPFMKRQTLRMSAVEILRLLSERIVFLPHSQRVEKAQAASQSPAQPPLKRAKTEEGSLEAEAAEQAVRAEDPAEVKAEQDAAKQAETGEEAEPQGKQLRAPLSDPETLRQLPGIEGGCVVCVLREEEARQLGMEGLDVSGSYADPVACVTWRGRASLSLMVEKNAAVHMAEKLSAAIAARAHPAAAGA